jgi:hypothetical protein
MYLLIVAYVLGAFATSFPAAAALMQVGGYTSLGKLDREDWLLLALGSILWPLSWLSALWLNAAKAYLRADVRRRLKGLGADHEEGTTHD